MPAPIALFAFNRPDHLRRTLEALTANELASESDLTIFCDGPRTEEEKVLTDAVRAIASEAAGFRSVQMVMRAHNMGCADSIIAGVSQILSQHERIIVIEDDILCSPHTLRFLNMGLEKYADEPIVFNISAWSLPHRIAPIPASYPYGAYFVPRFNCWGWASWRDRWKKIDWAVSDYTDFAKRDCLQQAFNQGGEDLSPMLDLQMDTRINSWAIRMDYARFKHGCVGLNPVYSYTTNIGMGSGTHTTDFTARFDNDLSLAQKSPALPEHIFVDQEISSICYKAYSRPNLAIRALNKGWRILFEKNLIDR